jgi:hypothetical protein
MISLSDSAKVTLLAYIQNTSRITAGIASHNIRYNQSLSKKANRISRNCPRQWRIFDRLAVKILSIGPTNSITVSKKNANFSMGHFLFLMRSMNNLQ